MAGETATRKKTGMSNTGIIGICLVVLILGGAGLYIFKKKSDKQARLDEAALILEAAIAVDNSTKDNGSDDLTTDLSGSNAN